MDWYPWGEEALTRARDQQKPLIVSIGYSACHWCHVMERESFEDPEVAAVMNEHFVPVKVDREERPDVDAIYMDAVQAMTGHGGWPLNAFLTPEGVPFYAGTYFPPEPRHGMPSWRMVLEGIARAWDEQRDQIVDGAEQIVGRLGASAQLQAPDAEIDPASLDAAVATLKRAYDAEHGGWGGAPKFPAASTIEFLLRRGERQMALHTLRRMAGGGMYDQVGGGFSRYSVDERWIVPHFEKMLYDNALLARAYLHAFQVSGEPFFERVDARDARLGAARPAPGGGRLRQRARRRLRGRRGQVLRLEARRGARGARAAGGRRDRALRHDRGRQLRGRQHPRARHLRPRAARRDQGRPARGPLEARVAGARRQAPDRLERADDLGAGRRRRRARRAALRDAAVAAAEFVLRDLRDGDGRLLRSYNHGTAHLNAYLEDHAFLLEALLTLYEATFDPRWFTEARSLADTILERFADSERGGFFSTATDHEELIARRKDIDDHPIPSGSSAAAFGLLRLARLTGESRYEDAALGHIRLLHVIAPGHAPGFGHLLQAIDFLLADVREVALVGRRPRAARAGRARAVPAARGAGGRAGGRRAAARGPRAGRRPGRRLRLRALRVPAAGDRAGRAARAARSHLVSGAFARGIR